MTFTHVTLPRRVLSSSADPSDKLSYLNASCATRHSRAVSHICVFVNTTAHPPEPIGWSWCSQEALIKQNFSLIKRLALG